MSSVYKQFTAQDFATVPFNAHKQYNLNSSSAASNKITYHSAKWTSESISLYSSASSNPYGVFDPINTIKYNQIDNTFYKNFKLRSDKTIGRFDYRNQKRELYENVNILSIPSGLYGHEIKPGSFYLSSSKYEIIDDTYGNLIISGGHNTNNYPTDINKNLFRLDPINGYRKYDLSILDGYMIDYGDFFVPVDGEGNAVEGETPKRYRRFWRKGEKDPNAKTYFTNEGSYIFDDSYYFNHLKYKDIRFQTSSLGHLNNRFPIMNFNSVTGSYIVSPNKNLYNFDRDDDFAISFWIEPQTHETNAVFEVELKDNFGGGVVFYKDDDQILVVYPTLYKTSTKFTDGLNSFSVEITNMSDNTLGGGANNTANMAAYGATNPNKFLLAEEVDNLNLGGYSDWYIPNGAELSEIAKTLGKNHPLSNTSNPLERDLFNNDYIDLGLVGIPNGDYPFGPIFRYHQGPELADFKDVEVWTSLMIENELVRTWAPIKPKTYYFTAEADVETGPLVGNPIVSSDPNNDLSNSFPWPFTGAPNNARNTNSNPNEILSNYFGEDINFTFLVRKISTNYNIYDINDHKRYIIAKSGTKSIIPTPLAGQASTLNTMTAGNMQYQNTSAESQFPYEIYLKSSSLCFDRSDGTHIASACYEITGSNSDGTPTGESIIKYSHIVCQNSASEMQIWFDGTKVSTLDSTTVLKKTKTRNNANLYIGSRGKTTQNDGIVSLTEDSPIITDRFFNGNIGYVNIFNHHLESSSITPMSESVNNCPYLGNLFYQNGFATITHPNYYDVLANATYGIADSTATNTEGNGFVIGQNFIVGGTEGIFNLKFQGSHLIYEHEYQCTVDEYEFNQTMNPTARNPKMGKEHELADFTTGSFFRPYVTTIGLYNEDNELLVVGKLGQPIRMSNETDTTFIMRWDT